MNELYYYLDILGLSISILIFGAIALFIYFKNRTAPSNRAFSTLVMLIILWALGTLLQATNLDPQRELLLWRLPRLAGTFTVIYLLYFSLVFPKDKNLSFSSKLIIFLPALFFVFFVFSDQCIKGFIILDPKYMRTEPIYGSFYFLYNIFISIYSIAALSHMFVKWFRTSGILRVKVSYMVMAVFIGILSSVGMGLWLPMFGIESHRSVGVMLMIIPALIVAYAIVRYQLFAITPKIAAQEILTSLGRSVLVCDLHGKILYGGEGGFKPNERELSRLIDAAVSRGFFKEYRTIIGKTPYNVTANFMREGGGIVMIFYDLTEIDKQEEKERKTYLELEQRLEKEEAARKVLAKIASEFNPSEIDKILDSSKKIMGEKLEALQAFEKMAILNKERINLLSEIQKDKDALEEKFKEIEKINKESVQRELKMIELKEKIRQLKEEKELT